VQAMVLTEEEGLELLAYLVAAARTQLDEAAEYGPLRLLTATHRLATFMAPRSSQATRALIEDSIQPMRETATRSADPDGYVAALDAVCGALAEHPIPHTTPSEGRGRRFCGCWSRLSRVARRPDREGRVAEAP
jgi:hypothetical protein